MFTSLAFKRGLLFSKTKNFIPLRPRAIHTGSPRFKFRPRTGVITLACAAGLGLGFSTIYSDRNDEERVLPAVPISQLIRTYFVYTMCSFPSLVDSAPRALDVSMSIPGLNVIAEAFVRRTFFNQFVGGDTAEKTLPVIRDLRASNTGALFAYSVEVDEAEAFGQVVQHEEGKESPYKRIVNEMIHCIDVAADFEDAQGKTMGARRTWVAVKITALVENANALIKLSEYLLHARPAFKPPIAFPGCATSSDLDFIYDKSLARQEKAGLTAKDIASLIDLHADLVRICARAQERGVRIIIDAEYSWYQPAIDAYVLSLMRRFNTLDKKQSTAVQPLIYGTFQAYLKRTPNHLSQSLKDAQSNNYAIGVKLVRGAYHSHELAAFDNARLGKPSLCISPEDSVPVWLKKEDTDACYHACVGMLADAVKRDIPRSTQTVGVLFGTHNWQSVKFIVQSLVIRGLAVQSEEEVVKLEDRVTDRVTFGQLYGMADDLTSYLVNKTSSSTPFVIKYIPYGSLSETMPYLSRRAIENKSVLENGAAEEERMRAGKEIRRRVLAVLRLD